MDIRSRLIQKLTLKIKGLRWEGGEREEKFRREEFLGEFLQIRIITERKKNLKKERKFHPLPFNSRKKFI